MSSNTRTLLILLILLSAGLALSRARPSAVPESPVRSVVVDVKRTPASTLNLPAGSQIAPPAIAGNTPYEKELKSYYELEQKVFLNEMEHQEMNRLIHNRDFLKSAAIRLHRYPSSVESTIEQNATLDLILQALRSGDTQVAAAVLKDVITDAQVENPRVDLRTRQNLGGLKAEILFQWTAIDPNRAREIESWLPGPISRKIWNNVVNAQKSNLAESSALEE